MALENRLKKGSTLICINAFVFQRMETAFHSFHINIISIFFNFMIKKSYIFGSLTIKRVSVDSIRKAALILTSSSGQKLLFFPITGSEWYNDASELIFSLSVDPKCERIH